MLRNPIKRFASLALAVTVVAALMAPQAAFAATSLKLSGSTTVQPLAQEFATAFKKTSTGKGWTITVAGGGSSVGFKDAAAGRVDIGMSSRDPKSSDPAGLEYHVVARDSLAVIVHPSNKVRKLTEAQVRDIYHGKITNWRQVGGANASIVLCGRTGASGTYEYFKEAFLANKRQSSRTKGYASNGMVRSGVARNKNAIGYVGMAFVNSSVRGVTMGGVAPTRANALSGKYKYVRPLYFITKGAPSGNTKKFLDWCKSSAGQKVAGKEFLPIR
ncbi:MAG: phosphate ABC transporter substrate-binding protein [Coriobacteriia bacterium]|nr:phosphate ABC transporter substrate-binding protein [Coriobacteriia bacterium]